MCGICGAIGFDSKETGEAVVRRMLAATVHRGPDEEGILVAPPVVAGTRRLSIIDLPGGSQPVWNETGTLAVVYNGEIYNFRELRRELEASGHKFRTRSDTEVVVDAYEQWGEEWPRNPRNVCFRRDRITPGTQRSRCVRLSRARSMGIKPLYYTRTSEAFLFASEVRALFASRCVPPQLSEEAVPSYLCSGRSASP